MKFHHCLILGYLGKIYLIHSEEIISGYDDFGFENIALKKLILYGLVGQSKILVKYSKRLHA